jgi:hypothetical protein
MESNDNKDIFPSEEGFYCCFAFEDAEIILSYFKNPRRTDLCTNIMEWVEVFRAIQLTSLLPAYDKDITNNIITERSENQKTTTKIYENPYYKGYFNVKRNETMV